MSSARWDDLAELEPVQLLNRLYDNLQQVLESRVGSGGSEDDILVRLPEPLQVLHYLNELEFEVTQGALPAYFGNSAGRHCIESVRALELIGANEMAKALAAAARVVGVNQDGWDVRDAELAEAREFDIVYPYQDLEGVDELDELTDRYREAEDTDDWGDRLIDYLVKEATTLTRWAERAT